MPETREKHGLAPDFWRDIRLAETDPQAGVRLLVLGTSVLRIPREAQYCRNRNRKARSLSCPAAVSVRITLVPHTTASWRTGSCEARARSSVPHGQKLCREL